MFAASTGLFASKLGSYGRACLVAAQLAGDGISCSSIDVRRQHRPVASKLGCYRRGRKKTAIQSRFFYFTSSMSCRRGRADQVVEGSQRCFGTLAHRDNDLLVRRGGDVTGREHAGVAGFATGVDDDLATRA